MTVGTTGHGSSSTSKMGSHFGTPKVPGAVSYLHLLLYLFIQKERILVLVLGSSSSRSCKGACLLCRRHGAWI